jgi:hypothetical protein
LSAVDLRPLTLGELLDRTFSYYRQHFLLFVGIMAAPQVFAAINGLFSFSALTPMFSTPPGTNPAQVSSMLVRLFSRLAVALLLFSVVYAAVYAAAVAATTFAVSDIHLGVSSSIRSAYRRVRGHIAGLIGVMWGLGWRAAACGAAVVIASLAMGALIGLVAAAASATLQTSPRLSLLVFPVIILGYLAAFIAAGFILLRYALAIPALLLEGLRARDALRRSWKLTRGNMGRLFLIVVLMAVIRWVAWAIFTGPFFIAAIVFATRVGQMSPWLYFPMSVSGAVSAALTGPLLAISLVLLYYDVRVRREGFDLEWMLSALQRGTRETAAPSAPLPSP